MSRGTKKALRVAGIAIYWGWVAAALGLDLFGITRGPDGKFKEVSVRWWIGSFLVVGLAWLLHRMGREKKNEGGNTRRH